MTDNAVESKQGGARVRLPPPLAFLAAIIAGWLIPGLRVHGRAGQPCPVCGDVIREVSFATRSLQYCPTCQTGGKVLADRRMSRLIR